jgi:hypothetical protein
MSKNVKEWLQSHVGNIYGVRISQYLADHINELAWRIMFVVTTRACSEAADSGLDVLFIQDVVGTALGMFTGDFMQSIANISSESFTHLQSQRETQEAPETQGTPETQGIPDEQMPEIDETAPDSIASREIAALKKMADFFDED